MNDLLTAPRVLHTWVEQCPDENFLFQPVDGELHTLTFRETEDHARRMASALLGLGLQAGDKVAILGKNCAEWLITDFAIAMAGMVSVPIYPTASRDTIRYILDHSETKAIFVGQAG